MEHIHRANQNRLLILKIIVGLDCLLVIISALTQLFKVNISYTHIIVTIYLIVFSIVIILSEFSPYISQNYLTVVLPFLAKMLGRGIIMILIGTFLLDPFMGVFAQVIGVVTMICGIASIILHLVERNNDNDQYLPQTTNNSASHQTNMEYDGFMKKPARETPQHRDELELDDYTPPQL